MSVHQAKSNTYSSAELSNLIKIKATELGFFACGITSANPLKEDENRLSAWLDSGYHASMAYMANHFGKRVHPAELEPGAKSVIVVLLNYFTPLRQSDPDAPVISSYAMGKDYHYVLKERLHKLLEYIQNELAPCSGRAFVDSAPLLEKALARKAGLGWQGKNTLLIHPRQGSFLFIGELVVDLELQHDQPFGNNLCGSCSRCIDSCPTSAIIAPFTLNARKCISYLTIETKEAIPDELVTNLSNRLVGCDICQEVCPWNSRSIQHTVQEFEPKSALLDKTADAWYQLDQPAYKQLFKGTAVERAGFRRMKKTLEHLSRKK